MNRKTFLKTGTFGIVAATLGASRLKSAPPAPPTLPASPALPACDAAAPETFWEAVRAQYPLTRDLAYFNTGGLGPASERVLATFETLTRKLQERSETGHGCFDQAREVLARFLGAGKDEICFMRNATEGNATVSAGLDLRRGDEVIFDSHAHPGGSYPWLNMQKTKGIVTKLFEPSIVSPEENYERIAALVTPRTRVIQVSHVTAPTGLLMPVGAIAKLCRGRGIWFHVDAAQTAGMFPHNLRDIGCDSYATSGHKWLGAPHETGVFYVRRDRQDELPPPLVGAYSGDTPGGLLPGEFSYAKTAVRYEYATRNAAMVMAVAEAAKFQEEIGRERIAARGRALAAQVRDGLSRIAGVELLTPHASTGLTASIVAFRSPRLDCNKFFGRLLGEFKLRTRPVSEQGLDALRVSTHLFNTPAECARLVEGVEKVMGGA
jgi:selenocysteine lyase/cysteine desulfurase